MTQSDRLKIYFFHKVAKVEKWYVLLHLKVLKLTV